MELFKKYSEHLCDDWHKTLSTHSSTNIHLYSRGETQGEEGNVVAQGCAT